MPRISELPALAQATSGDLIPIVDDAGNITKKVTADKVVPDGSVVTNQLANSAVTTAKIDDSAVTSAKIDWTTLNEVASITSNFSTSSTSFADVTGLSKTVNINSGERVKITFECGQYVSMNASNVGFSAQCLEDGVVIGGRTVTSSASNYGLNVSFVCYSLSPSAGNHTYKIQIGSGTSATKTINCTANIPATISVERY